MNFIKERIDKITELTNEWRTLVSKDHCKDRDFHFYIETEWSYGYPPKYFVVHHGYILDEVQEEYETYEKAQDGLISLLSRAIDDEKVHQATVEDF